MSLETRSIEAVPLFSVPARAPLLSSAAPRCLLRRLRLVRTRCNGVLGDTAGAAAAPVLDDAQRRRRRLRLRRARRAAVACSQRRRSCHAAAPVVRLVRVRIRGRCTVAHADAARRRRRLPLRRPCGSALSAAAVGLGRRRAPCLRVPSDAPTPVAFGRERSGSGVGALSFAVPGASGADAWDAVARRVEALGARLEAVRRVREGVCFAPQEGTGLAQPPPAQRAALPSAPSSPMQWPAQLSAPPLPQYSQLAPHLQGATPPPRAAAASAPTAPPLPRQLSAGRAQERFSGSPGAYSPAALSSGGDVAAPSDAECDAAAARAEAAFRAALETAQRVVAKVAGHVETALTPTQRAPTPGRRASVGSV